MPILPLFFKSKMMQLPDKIKIENCIFINKLPPPILNSSFAFSSTSNNYETSFATKGHQKIPTVTKQHTYIKGAFIRMTTKTWNKIFKVKMQTHFLSK